MSQKYLPIRTLLASLLLLIISGVTQAQDVVNWKYYTKKIADQTYEVHITASVSPSWHIYSQTTPEGGPLPTTISFTKNPLLSFTGSPREVGKLRQKHEEVFGVDVKYFDGEVDFVQVVNLKNKVKTNLSGSIEFMVCNDSQCLPPQTIPFSIKLE